MPSFDDLRHEFEQQPQLQGDRMSEIAAAVQQRRDGLASVLDKRDQSELQATIFVGLFYSVCAIFFTNPLSRIGALIAVLGCIEIAVVMKRARKPLVPNPLSLSFADSLSHEITMLNRQIALLRHVAWWYIAPLYVGACLFVAGFGWIWFTAIFAIGYFALCTLIWRANQTARTKELEPLRDNLEAARLATEHPDDPAINHAAVVRQLAHDPFATADDEDDDAITDSAYRDLVQRAWKFIDSIIVLVLMFWGGMMAGGMVDAALDGEPIGETKDGLFAAIGSFAAAVYALWTKPVDWKLIRDIITNERADSLNDN